MFAVFDVVHVLVVAVVAVVVSVVAVAVAVAVVVSVVAIPVVLPTPGDLSYRVPRTCYSSLSRWPEHSN